jgi:hypothetical protein
VNSSFWVMLSFVSLERFSDFDSDRVLILIYLLMGERPCIQMDLVDLVFDAREEREVDRVNKGIVGIDCNLTVGFRCNRIQLVNHRNYNCDEGGRIAGLEVGHSH